MKTITLEIDEDVFAELRFTVMARHLLGHTEVCKLTQFMGLIIQALEAEQGRTHIKKKGPDMEQQESG
jgi:hypothetical protein